MPGRQDEPVAVGPLGRGGVEFQVLLEEHGRHVGHAHGHPRMARVRGLHGVDREHADRGGLGPVVGVKLSQAGDVHGARSFCRAQMSPLDTSRGAKIKRGLRLFMSGIKPVAQALVLKQG